MDGTDCKRVSRWPSQRSRDASHAVTTMVRMARSTSSKTRRIRRPAGISLSWVRLTTFFPPTLRSHTDADEAVIDQVAPQFTLTSASADSSFLTTLLEALSAVPPSSSTSSSTSDPAQVKLEYRPPREFYASAGSSALAGLKILEGGLWGEEGDKSESGGSQGAGRKRRRGHGTGEGDDERRNGHLRLESFVGGLQSCPLTVSCTFLSRVLVLTLLISARLCSESVGASLETCECSGRVGSRGRRVGSIGIGGHAIVRARLLPSDHD